MLFEAWAGRVSRQSVNFSVNNLILLLLLLSSFIYFERERERARVREHMHEQGRGRERGKERILSSLYADMGLSLMNCEIMT